MLTMALLRVLGCYRLLVARALLCVLGGDHGVAMWGCLLRCFEWLPECCYVVS